MGFANIYKSAVVALTIANQACAVNYFVTFGDSYSQTGFDVSGTKPSASNPLGNPTYPGWTTSGGANWIGYLVKNYNASSLYSYNFADGGATVNASIVKPFQSTVKSLIDQVKIFSDNIAAKPSYAPWTSENSVFGIWLGVNDVGNSWWLSNETTVLNQVMDSYFGQVQILYKAGARNFVFLGVPPIDKTPSMIAQGATAQEGEAKIIAQYNSLLANRTAAFTAANAGSKAVVVDTQTPFNTVLADPAKYGAKNATCYNSDGKTCLWFNDYHPGMAIHDAVAKNVAKTWGKGPFLAS